MYDKNIRPPISSVYLDNLSRLHTVTDSDNPVSDSIQDGITESPSSDSADVEQSENTSTSDSQEEHTEEKETVIEDTKEENTEATDNPEPNTETATEAGELETEDNSATEAVTAEQTAEVETETETDSETETETETSVDAVSFSDSGGDYSDLITLMQENNELLEKQYSVTSCYLNLLTFTLLTIWVISSIHKSVARMSRRKEKTWTHS